MDDRDLRSSSALQLYFSLRNNTNDVKMFARGPLTILPDEPRKPRLRPEGVEYLQRHWRGTGAAELIHGLGIQGSAAVFHRPGGKDRRKKAKNFIAQNKKDLATFDAEMKTLKLELTPNSANPNLNPARRPASANRYANVKSKLFDPNHRPQSAIAAFPSKLTKSNVAGNRRQFKLANEEAATRDAAAVIAQEKEDVAPNPATPTPPAPRPPKTSGRPAPPRAASAQALDRKQQRAEDFIKLNIKAVGNNAASGRPRSASADLGVKYPPKLATTPTESHKPGEVPKYLIHRKIQWENSKRKDEPEKIPEGHRLMPAEEKVQTLEILKHAEQELLCKINSLPVRSDTTFLVRKKSEYERKLLEIDEAVKVLSRPKVLVKND